MEKQDDSNHEEDIFDAEITRKRNSLRSLHYIANLKNTMKKEFNLEQKLGLNYQMMNLGKFTDNMKQYFETLKSTEKEIEDNHIEREQTTVEGENVNASVDATGHLIESIDYELTSNVLEKNESDLVEEIHGDSELNELEDAEEYKFEPPSTIEKNELDEKHVDSYVIEEETESFEAEGLDQNTTRGIKQGKSSQPGEEGTDYYIEHLDYESSTPLVNELDLNTTEESHEGNIDLGIIDTDTEWEPVENLTIVTEAIVKEITSIDESSYNEANEHIGENLFSQDIHLEYHQLIKNTIGEDLDFDIEEESQFEEDKSSEMVGDESLISSIVTDRVGEEGSSRELIEPLERPIIVSRSDVGDDTDNLLDQRPTAISDTNKPVQLYENGLEVKLTEENYDGDVMPIMSDVSKDKASGEVTEEAINPDFIEKMKPQETTKDEKAEARFKEVEDDEKAVLGIDKQTREPSSDNRGDPEEDPILEHEIDDTEFLVDHDEVIGLTMVKTTEETNIINTIEVISEDIKDFEREIESFVESGVSSSDNQADKKYKIKFLENQSVKYPDKNSEKRVDVEEEFEKEETGKEEIDSSEEDDAKLLEKSLVSSSIEPLMKARAEERNETSEEFESIDDEDLLEMKHIPKISPKEASREEMYSRNLKAKKKVYGSEMMFFDDDTELSGEEVRNNYFEPAGQTKEEKSNSAEADGDMSRPEFHVSQNNGKDNTLVPEAPVSLTRRSNPWSRKFEFLRVGKKVVMILRRG